MVNKAKADAGFLTLKANYRPFRDNHVRPLYGDEYGRIKFDDFPSLAQFN
jgi:hypothetical protein